MNIFDEILNRSENLNRHAIIGRQTLSFEDVNRHAASIAEVLGRSGVRPGHRVGICLDQGPAYLASLLGIYMADAVSVLLTPDWTAREKDRVIRSAQLTSVISGTQVVGSEKPRDLLPIDGIDVSVLSFGLDDDITCEPGDAVIIFTSGTTNMPKGVVLSADSVSANVRAVADYLEITDLDRCPVFTPPCYAYSLSQNLVNALRGCSTLPVPTGLRFPGEILRDIHHHGLTGISATPTALRLFCNTNTNDALDFSSVRFVMVGGQFLDIELVERIEQSFPSADVVNMYGISENCPRVSYHYVKSRQGLDEMGYFAVGTPVNGTKVRVLDDDGQHVAPGNVGEIVVGGDSLMRGYWNDEDETTARLHDGWFHTRDLGYVDDDGLLHIAGRNNNVINVGNDKVIPEEVEKILLESEEIEDAAVFGQPDKLTGEAVCAMVVSAAPGDGHLAMVQRQCRGKLSGYKVPRHVTGVDAVPRTLYGKIDRKALTQGLSDQ
ncbi:MAG: acyl--CoA ligase [Rhodospirillaceae bacterium]|nr:acyl--CoA ligase [Rhodospirillaceae bacterium]